MNKKTRLSRLKKLKYMMDNHGKLFKKKATFNMDTWAELDSDSACGTAACALGSAGLYPPFRKQGLKTTVGYSGFGAVMYKGYEDFRAGIEFFGITEAESINLFNNGNNYSCTLRDNKITEQMVSRRIDKLIKKYSKAA